MAQVHTETLPGFSPPGNLSELSQENRTKWSNFISNQIDSEIAAGSGGGTHGSPLTQFFNGTVRAYNIGQRGATITWIGFPNKIKVAEGDDDERRWRAADSSRDVQDEYLEWSLIRNNTGNIVRVVFTCEGPEYWEFLAQNQKDTAIDDIYQLNAPLLEDVPRKSFFFVDSTDPNNESKWRYNPGNRFNSSTTTGTISHLVQTANTLGAEINIAARATVLRKKRGTNTPVTESDELIRCSQYGDPDRNSDPRIGFSVNQIALAGNAVSLKDPVALYMTNFDRGNFKLDRMGDLDALEPIPDGTFTFERGDIDNQQGLRLKIQIPDGVAAPDGRQLIVSDIYDTRNQRHIDFGAQFADYITMGVHGVVIPEVQKAPPEFCLRRDFAQNSFAAMVPQLKKTIEKQVSPLTRFSDVPISERGR